MAQTNFTPISLYFSATAAAVPTAGNLIAGELAINTNDGKLFYKDSAGVVQVLASKVGASGSFTNLSYTGTLTGGTGVVNLGSGQFYKDASGNVGIGTSSPVAVGGYGSLTLNGTTGSLVYLQTNASSAMQIATNASGASIAAIGASLPLYFSTNSVERMRIDSSGNALFNTTDADAGINGTPSKTEVSLRTSSEGIRVSQTGASYFNRLNTGDMIGFKTNGTQVGSISVTGSTTGYNITSDIRLKTNIVDAPSGNINDIKVRSFDWIRDNNHQIYGVIAQELLEVAPYAVHQPQDPEEMMAVDYSKLVPMMIKEIQDLKQRIKTLENK